MQNPKPYPPILGYNETLERRLKTFWDFNDWVGIATTSSGIWTAGASGTGAAMTNSGPMTNTRAGLARATTGTTATGRAGCYANPGSFLLGGGVYTYETDILIDTLSTLAETYALYIGFGDDVAAEPVDGAYFKYSSSGATPNWYAVTANNSTRTTTDTSTAAAASWTRLKIVVNANASSVAYYINGVNVANITTNIPTGAGRQTGAIFNIIKSAGTTARVFDVDWTWVHVDLNTSR